ncbi:hypothetical protein J1N35_012920 [Gossypium stocksii]|uniref:mitogen-activated protein kinase n=1 Tax=Gossypium stocksii TaxID=47602 RepID=A0A9D3VTT6_9ROSI|nr:hypothetical protein J1N35_012920 [Gossypium stocksii]
MGYDIYGNIFEVTAKYKPPIEPIGMGGYGIICMVNSSSGSVLNSETNEEVALKQVANAFDNLNYAKRILREIKMLLQMDHENVWINTHQHSPSRSSPSIIFFLSSTTKGLLWN